MKLASPEKRGVTIPEAGWNRAKRCARAPADSLSSAMTILPRRGVFTATCSDGAISPALRIKPPVSSGRKPFHEAVS
ncbi:hypothetical protein MEX01_38920 [Methylorubrum extorquens]|nr:hypothetical protein MEX01_38920 [Methylorubrum extorquens]